MPESRIPRDDDRSSPDPAVVRERLEQAERERDVLRRENDRLRQQVDHLKRQLDDARRAGYRQAAPFAKPLKRDPKRPGRHAGGGYGAKGRRPLPAHVDETHHARLPPRCPGCGDRVVETGVATQYQEELPVPQVAVRAFQVSIGRCRGCGRRVQGRHALQTSNALGAAAVQLGPQAVAFAVILNKQLGLSYGKIATLFQQQYRLTVTRGGLVQAVQRAARHAQPTYAALCATVRGSPMVSPDETGWKVGGHLQWLWAFATPDTTVYRIQPGRGFDEAAAVLGADFAGVLVRDGWAPYRRFTAATHQTCLAHLLRRCRLVAADHPRTTFATEVQAMLQQGLTLRDRHRAGHVSAHGLAVARGRLITRLHERLSRPCQVPDVRRFAAHLDRELHAVWSFLFDPTIDATNWRAEQAIRPAVVTRKVWGGNRTWAGADAQHTLASVIRTAQQRHLNPQTLLASLLQAPVALLPVELQSPAVN